MIVANFEFSAIVTYFDGTTNTYTATVDKVGDIIEWTP